MRRIELVLAAALLLLAVGLLWLEPALLFQTLAGLILTLVLPGWLSVRLWVGRTPVAPTSLEQMVYAVGVGFGAQSLFVLLMSYWPGPLVRPPVMLLFVAVNAVLCGLLWRNDWTHVASATTHPDERRPGPPWTTPALAVILVVAAWLRLTGLNYSEFQGDEARAALRAAAVLQGYENVLFLHRKGPLEILSPATTYVLTGHLTEATARLPFALASLAGVLALYLLGGRMFGPLAGCVAALLLAVDGYFIGFARIVQYQSVVLLTTTATVLILYQLPQRRAAAIRWLTLAAFLIATGALAHYEAILALIPALYLIWRWWRGGQLPCPTTALLAALVTGAIPLTLFYLPYILSPSFANTYAYLTGERIGDAPPYNHLADFFLRTTLYSTSYAVLLQIGLAALALVQLYRRGLRSPWSWVAGVIMVAGVAWSFVQPHWLVIGGQDLTGLFFLAAFAGAWFLPNVATPERMLWGWFGLLVVLALFLVEKPRTHVYVFFIPWVLLSGMTAQRLTGWLGQVWSPLAAQAVAAASMAACLLLFGAYAYWYFVHNQIEVFRTWHENRPRGYWTPYDEPDTRSLFGFPQRNGWKLAGVLYAQGELAGAYTTNGVDEWVTDWYTRGAERCLRDHDNLIISDHLEYVNQARKADLLAELSQPYRLFVTAMVNNQPRLQVWRRSDNPSSMQTAPIEIPSEAAGAEFDAHLSGPNFPLRAPAVEPPIAQRLQVRFGEQIRLQGFAVESATGKAGESLPLMLYWRGAGPIEERYRIVTEVVNDEGLRIASAAGEPACDEQPTDDWPAGELIVDPYKLSIADDAKPGQYNLFLHLVNRETGEVLAADLGERVRLGVVEIED
jgi:4-amino-4-deoxy-L-arabinose transferase-like glycosyltransferase